MNWPQPRTPCSRPSAIRKLHRLAALDTSYRNLGRCGWPQGDVRIRLGAAGRTPWTRSRHPRGLIPTWDIYHARGRVRLAEGRPEEALEDFRDGACGWRAWRRGVAPSDAIRLSAEQLIDQAYGSLVETAAGLYFRSGRAALAREAFEATEENRAASLRARAGAGPRLAAAAAGGLLGNAGPARRPPRSDLLRNPGPADGGRHPPVASRADGNGNRRRAGQRGGNRRPAGPGARGAARRRGVPGVPPGRAGSLPLGAGPVGDGRSTGWPAAPNWRGRREISRRRARRPRRRRGGRGAALPHAVRAAGAALPRAGRAGCWGRRKTSSPSPTRRWWRPDGTDGRYTWPSATRRRSFREPGYWECTG